MKQFIWHIGDMEVNMSETSPTDIRKKLLELQNELLKGVIEKGEQPPQNSENKQAVKEPIANSPRTKEVHPIDENGLAAILKEMYKNQVKIITLLQEINNKIK